MLVGAHRGPGVLCVLLSQGAIYDVQPGEASGKPGSVIRYGRSKGKDRAVRAAAVRILYRSTNPSGEPIAVSGAILFPPGPAPAGGRDVIMS